MATTTMFVEGETGRGSFTFMTHVAPSQSAPAGTGFEFPAPATSHSHTNPNLSSRLVKGEPKALGTVQIMIGLMMLLLGIVISSFNETFLTGTGFTIRGPIFYIISGALTVATANYHNPYIVKCSQAVNIISATVAGIIMIMISIDLAISKSLYDRHKNSRDLKTSQKGQYIEVTALLLILTFFQFIICVCVSGFTCKAYCSKPRTLDVVGSPMKHLPA